uniref:DUF1572 family protein n=1 Tax=Paenibacillus sp. FSL W8-1187 TaxID=2975339 RepID=UPI00403F13B2
MTEPYAADARELGARMLEDARNVFRSQKKLGDRTLAQAGEEALFAVPAPESNSIAVIVRHLSGNMKSRWTDFLTTDGEKPWRDRDGEFELPPETTAAEVIRWWEDGWRIVFETLDGLRPEDLMRTVTIRSEPHLVLQTIQRQLSHYGYHVGQIVQLAKASRAASWQSLSIPRNESRAFNRRLGHEAGDAEK